MSKISNELEDKIQAIDKMIKSHSGQIELLKTSITEIEIHIDDLEIEKSQFQESLANEEAKFEPSLSAYDRNQSMGGV